MDLWDLIIFRNYRANAKLEGDIPTKEEKLSFKVKWQLVKYVIRKSIYWMQWLALVFILIWALQMDIFFDISIDIPNIYLVVLFFTLSILPTTIRTIFVISHSYIIKDKIYIRDVKFYKNRNGRSFLVEDHYCKVYFNKMLSDGNVTEHIVKGSKEMYIKKENAKYIVFVYKNQPYFMVDDSL